MNAQARAIESSRLTAAVVVCTSSCERASLLEACIAALLRGRREPDELIVVVDSNAALARELARSLPSAVRLLQTERQGLSEARNAGVAATSADVVAFVDDDATVEPGWLGSIVEAFTEDEDVLAVGGPVLPSWAGDRRWMCDELLWVVGCTYRGHRRDAGPIRNPIGCNMAYRRCELLALGSFANGFGKRGNALETCEETELGLRLERRRGRDRIRYVPDARVHHFVPPARVSWRHLVRRSLAEGLAKGRLQRLYAPMALGHERAYLRLLVTARVPGMVFEGARRRDSQAALGALAILVSLAVSAIGFAAGIARESRRGHGSSAAHGEKVTFHGRG